MKHIDNRSAARIAASFGAATLMALGTALPSFADVTITGATQSGGGLTYGLFTGVTLNGTAQTSTGTFTFQNIIDPRGTGAGWNISMTLTPFSEWSTTYVGGGKAFATSSLQVTTASVVSWVDVTSSPTSTVTPAPVTTVLDAGAPVKLVSAAVGGGMGSYSLSMMTATLNVPANAYARQYKSDATVTTNAVP